MISQRVGDHARRTYREDRSNFSSWIHVMVVKNAWTWLLVMAMDFFHGLGDALWIHLGVM